MPEVTVAVDRAVAIFSQRAFMKTWNKVVDNLTEGWPMLKTRSGTLRANVESASSFWETGFRIAVGTIYGIAWHGRVVGSYPNWTIEPTPRKEFWVAPKNKKALHWWDPSGYHYFSKGHMIHAWKFDPPRPFIAKPLMELEGEYNTILREALRQEVGQAFPNKKVVITL